MERHVTSFPLPLLFFFFFLAGGAELCVLVMGKLFLGGFFFFPKDQGQEESTPRVVGGKKNNKAHERLGSTTLLTSSVIISAWLGCLGNLHNAILTPSLQLSITTAVEPPSWCTLAPSLTPGFFSPVVCLLLPPSHLLARLCLFPRPSLYLCLFFFIGLSKEKKKKK